MIVRKLLDVVENKRIDTEVHSGECLFIKDANETITTKATGGTGAHIYAYAFAVRTVSSPATLYNDGSVTVTLDSMSQFSVNGAPQSLGTALLTNAWNYFCLHDDGSLTVRVNDTVATSGASIADGVDRTISDLPVGSSISGILSLWGADVPADITGNLLYQDINFDVAGSAFYPLIENRTSIETLGWLFELIRYNDSARWNDAGFATFDLELGAVDVSYVNPYIGNEDVIYNVGGDAALHGSVSGEQVYSRNFIYSYDKGPFLQYPTFTTGYQRDITLSPSFTSTGDFAFEFELLNLDMSLAPIANGPVFSAYIEKGLLKIEFGASKAQAYVGDAQKSIRFGRSTNDFKFWVDNEPRAREIVYVQDIDFEITIDRLFSDGTNLALADSLYNLKLWESDDGSEIFEPDQQWVGFDNDWSETLGASPAITLTTTAGLISDLVGSNDPQKVSPVLNGDIPFNVDSNFAVYPTSDVEMLAPNDVDGNPLISAPLGARVFHIVPGTNGYRFDAQQSFHFISFNFIYYGAATDILEDVISVDSSGKVVATDAEVTVGGERTPDLSIGWNNITVTFENKLPAGQYKMKNTFSDLRLIENPVSLSVIRGINSREGHNS